jgi:CHAT domain
MSTVMELEIGAGPAPDSFVVRVLRSVGGGEPSASFSLDIEDLVARRPLLEASVLSSSVSARRVMSDQEAAIQAVGRQLFETAFAGEVGAAYRTSLAVASERGRGVQISLRLTAPGLAALPWEALFDADSDAYLCRKEPLVRHVPSPYSPPALAITPPLKVLGMVSAPRGLPLLDVGAERERLEDALGPHLEAGRVELHWLDDVSWAGVHGKLLEQEWHVLHFIGHGGYDTDTDEGVLALVGRNGRPNFVDASSLADLLDQAEPTPRLVVLNSCQSGAAGTEDLFSGTAAALAHSGIHAVAAMQYSISDDAAIAFARGFYTALAHGRGIDEAVRSGRIGILGLGRGTLEWVTPVLYLRGEDTKLFDVAPMVRRTDSASRPGAPKPTAAPTARTAALTTTTPSSGLTASAPAAASATPHAPAAAPPPDRPRTDTRPVEVPVALRPTYTPPAPPPPNDAASPPSSMAPPPSGSALGGRRTADVPHASRVTGIPPPGPPRAHPPSGPSASAAHPKRTPSRRKPWLVVSIIGTLAVAAGIATVITLSSGTTPEILPITAMIDARADAVWTQTDVHCAAGQTIRISAEGTVRWHDADPSVPVGPDGYADTVPAFWNIEGLGDAKHAALVGSLGAEPPYFVVGRSRDYTCPGEGDLFLAVNDPHRDDNSGAFKVTITPPPDE